jgi:hypothetical protein
VEKWLQTHEAKGRLVGGCHFRREGAIVPVDALSPISDRGLLCLLLETDACEFDVSARDSVLIQDCWCAWCADLCQITDLYHWLDTLQVTR